MGVVLSYKDFSCTFLVSDHGRGPLIATLLSRVYSSMVFFSHPGGRGQALRRAKLPEVTVRARFDAEMQDEVGSVAI